MTTNDIEKLQIVATTKNDEHLFISIDDNLMSILLPFLVESGAKFIKLKDELFENYSLSELVYDGERQEN